MPASSSGEKLGVGKDHVSIAGHSIKLVVTPAFISINSLRTPNAVSISQKP